MPSTRKKRQAAIADKTETLALKPEPLFLVAAENPDFTAWGIYDRPAGSERSYRIFAIVDSRSVAVAHATKLKGTVCNDRDLAVHGALGEKELPEALPAEGQQIEGHKLNDPEAQ